MKILHQLVLAAAVPAALASPVAARPNLNAPRPLGNLMVYADDQRPGLFYYGPGELAVVHGPDGRPEIHFVQMRYMGSVVTADRGRLLQRSLLGFRVAMEGPNAADLQAARRALAGAGPVDLRPLPIRRLEASLVYAPVGRAEETAALPSGHFEDAESDVPARPGVFWTTRSYALGLDPATSELFGGALAKGQVVLSLSYAFYAAGGAPASAEASQIVRAGALSISVDARRWPDFLRRVDINERVPPGYPLLDVYCYDFRDSLRPPLYEKQVEVEAESVGGRMVVSRARFGRDQPDLYARSLRFGVGVRLDRPYRYRVTEISDDGTSAVTAWRARASWTELLDITTPAGPTPDRPAEDRPGGER